MFNYVQWSVEPRVLLNVPGFAVAPGIGGSLVYQPFELLALSAEAAVYYGNGLEFANDNIQKLTMAEFNFEATIPLAIDPANILAFVSPKTPPPATPAEPAAPAAEPAPTAPNEPPAAPAPSEPPAAPPAPPTTP